MSSLAPMQLEVRLSAGQGLEADAALSLRPPAEGRQVPGWRVQGWKVSP